MGPRLALVIAVLVLGVVAPVASATTVAYSGDGSTLIVTGGDNANHEIQFRLVVDGAMNQYDDILDSAGITSYPGDCTLPAEHTGIRCPGHLNVQVDLGSGNDGITFVSQGFDCFNNYALNLGDGVNTLNLSDSCPPTETATVTSGSGADNLSGGSQGSISFNAGGGPDNVSGGSGGDVIHGGDGDDTVDGNAGNDMVFGDAGSDLVRGDAGDDRVDGGDGDDQLGKTSGGAANDDDQGSDDVHGGSGSDKLWLDKHTGGMTINLDNVKNDGAPNENDNIHSDIEDVVGTAGNDIYTGSPVIDRFDGNGGNDEIHGGDGNDNLSGGGGDDAMFGDAGDDKVEGANGADTVDGGAGSDQLYGDIAACSVFCSFDSDSILARDGAKDSVDCGGGADSAQVDHDDVVAFCASVDRAPAPAAGPAPAPAPGSGPSPNPTPTTTPFTFSTLGSLTRTKGVRVKVTCSAACTITATLVLGAKTARKVGLGKKAVTIGTGRAARLSAGSTTVTIRLTKKARSRLRRLKTVTATLKLAVKDSAGATTRKQRTVKLKR